MHQALADQLLHAEIVAAGKTHFRGPFVREFGSFFDGNRAQADHLADVVWQFFEGQWRTKYPQMSAEYFLDKVEIKTGPTDEEIENAWELEIGSSENAMRFMYEGSARTRKGADIFRGQKRRTE